MHRKGNPVKMKIFLCQDSWHEKDASATPASWEIKLN
jgi:hypothetical protein